MIDPSICKERIISEDYRDFIATDISELPILSNIPSDQLCEQTADFGYHCVYVSRLQAEPINLDRFLYNSIPKCYSLLSMEALNQAGILAVQNYPTLQLKGEHIMVGFLDTGIDYESPVFRNIDGTTRIAGIWDQTIQSGPPPENFAYGTEYTENDLNEALRADSPKTVVPLEDENGHGTYVASVACGGGVPNEQFLGAAPESTLAVVKLKTAKQYLRDYYFISDNTPCYQETDILLGLRYLNELARRYRMPLVICVALGTNMGGHIGILPLSSVLENYGMSSNRIPVIGVGNEADKRHHFYDVIQNNTDQKTVEIRVGENVDGFTMELWTEIPNVLSISIISPSGESSPLIPIRQGNSNIFNFLFDKTQVTINYRLIVKRTTSELIYFRFDAPTPGIWRLIVNPIRIIDGRFHIWLPITEFLSGEVFFLASNPDCTLTNPSNTVSTVVTSYYDSSNNSAALSSGRGYTRNEEINPDITAPGIQIRGALPNGRFTVRSGSSSAAGITAGAVALLMQWVIYHIGTPSIDAIQIKSLLILGASRTPDRSYPNREWGYGKLDLYNTFEEMTKY